MNTTPGPWAVNQVSPSRIVITYADGSLRSHVATLFDAALCPEHGSIQANASLIAAAPELLASLEETMAALRWYVAETSPNSEATGRINRAEAAIAKASGQS